MLLRFYGLYGLADGRDGFYLCARDVLLWGVATGRFLGWVTDAIEAGAES